MASNPEGDQGGEEGENQSEGSVEAEGHTMREGRHARRLSPLEVLCCRRCFDRVRHTPIRDEDDPPGATECRPSWSKAWNNLVLGQVISLVIAGTGISAASLSDRGVNLPNFVNFLNYLFLTAYLLFPARGTPRLPWWRYFLYAIVDVEANFLVVLSFKYTSITSVMLLDAFTVPAVMVLSRYYLNARYTRNNMVGVALCLCGLVLTVISDLDGSRAEQGYPHAVQGDLICLAGAFLYACSNVMQEGIVKHHDRREFLGMTGLWGSLLAGSSTLALERRAVAAASTWTPTVGGFVLGYAITLSAMYSLTSLFLQTGDATLFNLSLLTSDIYSVLFAYLVENASLSWVYFAAFAVIVAGLTAYHTNPPTTAAAVGDPAALAVLQRGSSNGHGHGPPSTPPPPPPHAAGFAALRGNDGGAADEEGLGVAGAAVAAAEETDCLSPLAGKGGSGAWGEGRGREAAML